MTNQTKLDGHTYVGTYLHSSELFYIRTLAIGSVRWGVSGLSVLRVYLKINDHSAFILILFTDRPLVD